MYEAYTSNEASLESDIPHILAGVLTERVIEEVCTIHNDIGMSKNCVDTLISLWKKKLSAYGTVLPVAVHKNEENNSNNDFLNQNIEHSDSYLLCSFPAVPSGIQQFKGTPNTFMKMPIFPAMKNVTNSRIIIKYSNDPNLIIKNVVLTEVNGMQSKLY